MNKDYFDLLDKVKKWDRQFLEHNYMNSNLALDYLNERATNSEKLASDLIKALKKCSPFLQKNITFECKCVFCNKLEHSDDCEYVRLTGE
jgi:hypothetical protein